MNPNSRSKVTISKVYYLLALIVLTLGCWLTASWLWGTLSPIWLIVFALAICLLTSPLVLAVKQASHKIWIYSSLFILALLFVPASLYARVFPVRSPEPFQSSLALTLLVMISIALVMAALLLYTGLSLDRTRNNVDAADHEESKVQRKYEVKTTALIFTLCVFLLARALYNLYWFMIWDNTTDPLGYFWLPIPFLAVLFSCVFLSLALPRWRKLASFSYLLLIPAMIVISGRSQQVNLRQLTDERAERVSQALDSYFDSKGQYPQELQQLTPWYILTVREPLIIFGQEWCYEAGQEYYRLGYVDRQHWSDPRLIGKIFSIKGQVPALPQMCEAEVAALQERDQNYPYTYWMESP
jgi:hypothetical protein